MVKLKINLEDEEGRNYSLPCEHYNLTNNLEIYFFMYIYAKMQYIIYSHFKQKCTNPSITLKHSNT